MKTKIINDEDDVCNDEDDGPVLKVRPSPQEARHHHALPVRGHGRRRPVRQLHVLWREEEVVRLGRRRPAGAQHLRLLPGPAGLLQRLAEGSCCCLLPPPSAPPPSQLLLLLQVRMYSRALAVVGGFLVLASGAGEVYRQKARSRSLQSTGQVFLGVYLICMVRPSAAPFQPASQ